MPIEVGDLRIELFDPARHDRAGFVCGVERLDNYLKLSAKKQQKNNMTRVYVAVEDGQVAILGYHTINLGVINADELAKRPRGAPDHGELPTFHGPLLVPDRPGKYRRASSNQFFSDCGSVDPFTFFR